MDHETFNNDADVSEADYRAFVQRLSERTAAELRHARGWPDDQRQALCRYYRRGLRANLSTGELVDFLGVSALSILDKAGCDDEEADALMALSADLTDEEIERAALDEAA